MECTLVTYTDGKRKLIYAWDPVVESDVSTISYPTPTSEQIKEINEATWDKVQAILSKY
jgi:hypothetical protein